MLSLVARAIAIVILLSLAACKSPKPAPLPADAVAFVAPPHFEVWWARTEACSGRRGKLNDIAWFVVPGSATFMTPGGPRVANWSRGATRSEIVMAGGSVTDEMVVRHEMLHALLDQGGHPKQFFEDQCHLTWQTWSTWAPDDTGQARSSARRD